MSDRIAVLGAGSWGIAAANLLVSNGHNVALWEFNPADCQTLLKTRSHEKKLPGIRIPSEVFITNNLDEAVAKAQILVLASPAQTMRSVCTQLEGVISEPRIFVNLAKGIEIKTVKRMSEVIEECLTMADAKNIATLSGPSHAEEVSRGMPTSVVIASANPELAEYVQGIFSNNTFRAYSSTDIIGVELGGSVKNIIAIAAGIITGLGLGDNTMGALITRGMVEISRLGVSLGADPLTFAGLSGIGDLVTTCISRHSRNQQVGFRIGRGEKLKSILGSMVMVAEGVDTCRSVRMLAENQNVEMPIAEQVHDVLFAGKNPAEAIEDLMGRTLKKEVLY